LSIAIVVAPGFSRRFTPPASRKPESRGSTDPKWAPPGKTTIARREILTAEMCDHFFDTTSRYDRDHKLLTFLLFCPSCLTETVVASLPYEPAFRRGSVPPDRAHGL
jgi:hypothetical protein